MCCDGFLACMGGFWVKEYPGCACQMGSGPFQCGSQSCGGNGEFCEGQEPKRADGGADAGDAGETMFMCMPIPGACNNTPSCACLKAQNVCDAGVDTCDEDAGVVTVKCM